jgi:uncharacterized membrane protein YgcG
MNTRTNVPANGKTARMKQTLAVLISGSLMLGALAGCASEPPAPETPPAAAVVQPSQQSTDQLDQLVAPIALYPDSLVAQILAAATYPTEVVEAERWMQQHSDLKGQALAQAVDQQSWDPSVKALAQFPSVLAMMDKNLSWTSSLGEAYVNQQQNVLDAVQAMRQRAQQAGNLKSTPQESVTSEGQTIVVQPANPEVVYVPEYDPWLVYGDPLAFYPGWVEVPGLWIDGPGIGFGVGIGIGIFGGFGWGWHHWGADWHGHGMTFDHHHYVSHSSTFMNHNRGFAGRGNFGHAGGYAGHASPGVHSGAFGGFNHGGVTGAYSSRGRASVGSASHAGGSHGGGFHGGGSHGGGGGHR